MSEQGHLPIARESVVTLESVAKVVGRLQNSQSELWRRHREMSTALEQILDYLEATPEGPLNWRTMGPRQRADLLKKVDDFVVFVDDVFLRDVQEVRLKPCWWRHPSVLWEVTALWAAFISTYGKNAAPSAHQSAFLQQCMWPTLQRIHAHGAMQHCKPGEHTDEHRARAMSRDPELDEQIAKWRGAEDDEQASRGDDGNASGDRGSQLQPDVDGAAGVDGGDDVDAGASDGLPGTAGGH